MKKKKVSPKKKLEEVKIEEVTTEETAKDHAMEPKQSPQPIRTWNDLLFMRPIPVAPVQDQAPVENVDPQETLEQPVEDQEQTPPQQRIRPWWSWI